MARRALVVGINQYNGRSPFGEISELKNPVRDAKAIAEKLDRHNSEDDNFAVETILVEGPNQQLTTAALYDRINTLLEGNYESVVFFFAGHGVRDELTQKDYLVTSDGTFPNYGVDLDYIVKLANSAYPNIRNVTIILDCCHAGAMAENNIFASGVSLVGKGVTILAGCNADETASDGTSGGHGLFTGLLLDGLDGQAGDLFGRITPASLYNLVDQRLNALQQRPVYKANVSEFALLRRAKERMSRKKVRAIVRCFDEDNFYPLSPACEPEEDRGNFKDKYTEKTLPFDKTEHKQYRLLQAGFREGIIQPNVSEDNRPEDWQGNWPPAEDGSYSMWHAAMYSTGCRLTSYGLHFKKLDLDENL